MDTFFRSGKAPTAWSVLAASILAFSVVGCSGKEPGPVTEGTGDGGEPGAGGTPGQGGTGGAAGTGSTPGTGGPACVNHADDFVPRVHQPICSNCHGVRDRLPDFGVPSVARAECSTIGDVVRRGVMPPDGSGYVLSREQRDLVAAFVALGCPETADAAAGSCSGSPTPGNGGTTGTGGAPATGNAPGVNGSVSIDRAEWDPDKQELRLEGTVDDTQATLTAEFAGRTEPVQNDQGSFREEFTGVVVRPPAVTVKASSGASATAAVVAD